MVPVVFERSGGEWKSEAIAGKNNGQTFVGIWVRQYMELPPASEQRGLVQWIDEIIPCKRAMLNVEGRSVIPIVKHLEDS